MPRIRNTENDPIDLCLDCFGLLNDGERLSDGEEFTLAPGSDAAVEIGEAGEFVVDNEIPDSYTILGYCCDLCNTILDDSDEVLP